LMGIGAVAAVIHAVVPSTCQRRASTCAREVVRNVDARTAH
jgi:hypothetical protein